MKHQVFLFFLLLSITAATAQTGTPSVAGAYGAGMGDASVVYTNIYSVVGNQAGMVNLDKAGAAVYGEQRFALPDLNSFGAIIALPTKKNGVFGVSLHNFGNTQKYAETKIGVAYALKLSDAISLGAQIDYLGTRIIDYGTNNSVTFEIGFLARLMPKFKIGAHIYSPMRVRLTETELIPTVLSVGGSYQPNEKVLISAEYEQDFRNNPTIKGGIDYRIADALSLRIGVGTGIVRVSGGIGLHLKQFTIDMAASYHQYLGFTPSVGVGMKF